MLLGLNECGHINGSMHCHLCMRKGEAQWCVSGCMCRQLQAGGYRNVGSLELCSG
jgi:hypothetical protein